jgi:uncharacterized protein (TIGR03000 family)
MSRLLCAFLGIGLTLLGGSSVTAEPEAKPVTMEIWLPAAARLLIEGKETKATGPVRHFVSPPLPDAPGSKYVYTLEAIIPGEAGDQVVTRRIEVTPGRHAKVDLRLARYVPTPQEAVEAMLEMAKVTKADVVWDLGCGDGRIPVTAAKKYGCKARGFDIDPARIRDSLANVEKNGVGNLVTIEKKDIFTLDMSKEPTIVTLYLLPEINVRLLPQLRKLSAGARVVSHAHKMADITPDATRTVATSQGDVNLYLWTAETLRAAARDAKARPLSGEPLIPER